MNISKSYTKKVKSVLAKMTTIRSSVHSLMLEAVLISFKTKDSEYITYLLNSLTSQQGSFRLQAVVYWFEVVAGYQCTLDKNGNYSSERIASNPNFTFNVAHLDTCKEESNRFWKIAPVEAKVKKLCDLDKVFTGSVVQLARSIKAGDLDMADIKLVIAKLEQDVLAESKSDKTASWVSDYMIESGIIEKPSISPTQEELDTLTALEAATV